jgi:hypothetical protein
MMALASLITAIFGPKPLLAVAAAVSHSVIDVVGIEALRSEAASQTPRSAVR